MYYIGQLRDTNSDNLPYRQETHQELHLRQKEGPPPRWVGPTKKRPLSRRGTWGMLWDAILACPAAPLTRVGSQLAPAAALDTTASAQSFMPRKFRPTCQSLRRRSLSPWSPSNASVTVYYQSFVSRDLIPLMMTSKMLCVWRQVHRCKAPNTPFVYIYIILVSLLPFILIFSNYLFCLSTLPLSKCLKGDIVLLSGQGP